MNETPEARRWRTVIHEVGHCAAALLLGVENIGAVVFDSGGGLATDKPETATLPPTSDYEESKLDTCYRGDAWPDLLKDATFTAAGCAAVDLILFKEKTETAVSGADAQMIYAAARAACPGADFYQQMSFSYLASARARALLRPILWRVQLCAKELNRRGRMNADEVVKTMYPEYVRTETTTPKKETPCESSSAAPVAGQVSGQS